MHWAIRRELVEMGESWGGDKATMYYVRSSHK